MKHLVSLHFIILLTLISGCAKMCDITVSFVGDSLVEGWDTGKCFPGWITYNYGLSGAQIDYLDTMKGKFAGKQIVVLIGTNNYFMLDSETRTQFAQDYLDAIEALDAKHIYLLSLLPRSPLSTYENLNVNPDIEAFNQLIENHVKQNERFTFINVYHSFIKEGKIQNYLYLDGLHLNRDGYKILTQSVKKAVNDNYCTEL